MLQLKDFKKKGDWLFCMRAKSMRVRRTAKEMMKKIEVKMQRMRWHSKADLGNLGKSDARGKEGETSD